jgi:hypothetical protein
MVRVDLIHDKSMDASVDAQMTENPDTKMRHRWTSHAAVETLVESVEGMTSRAQGLPPRAQMRGIHAAVLGTIVEHEMIEILGKVLRLAGTVDHHDQMNHIVHHRMRRTRFRLASHHQSGIVVQTGEDPGEMDRRMEEEVEEVRDQKTTMGGGKMRGGHQCRVGLLSHLEDANGGTKTDRHMTRASVGAADVRSAMLQRRLF